MDFSSFPPQFVDRMNRLMVERELQLPPPIFVDMEGEFVDMDLAAKTLTVRFPVQARYQNPMGYMQGGMIATAIDNTIGPLSFIVADPNVTKTMTVTYLRPIPATVSHITVAAAFESANGRELIFVADVMREDGAKFAHARSVNVKLRRKRPLQKD